MNKLLFVCGLILSLPVVADGDAILKEKCIECHATHSDGPRSLQELWKLKGPNLSSAGLKYKSAWMRQWLTNPTRIRPSGMFYGNNIAPGAEKDEVDASRLLKHMALSAGEAKAVTESLMKYKRQQKLFKSGAYKQGSISASMGDLLFVKIRGCSACHQIEPGYGGVSGPEMYTAAQRLQEDYIVSFLLNPQAWSPLNFMPALKLKDRDIQKFVHYFSALSKEQK
ncbi:MAG: c-type cytochrome [Gammaproteobacteria bacterium]|nr:c-type cytochrome [Gammaproteobacteria bacterium]MDH5800020.1 c-type cytochrome [Gammaproteobacteria bacterium]